MNEKIKKIDDYGSVDKHEGIGDPKKKEVISFKRKETLNNEFIKKRKEVISYFEGNDIIEKIKQNLKNTPERRGKTDIEIEGEAYDIQHDVIHKLETVKFKLAGKCNDPRTLGEYIKKTHTVHLYDETYEISDNNINQLLPAVSRTIEHELLHASGMDNHIVNTLIIEKYTDYTILEENLGIENTEYIPEVSDKKDNQEDLLNNLLKNVNGFSDNELKNLTEKEEKGLFYYSKSNELYVRLKMMKEEMERQGLDLNEEGIIELGNKIYIEKTMDRNEHGNIRDVLDLYKGQFENLSKILNGIVMEEGNEGSKYENLV